LRRFWAAAERAEPVDRFLAPGFEIVGALLPSGDALSADSVDQRMRQYDDDLASWSLRLRDALPEPEGERVAAVVEADATGRDGTEEARLRGAVYEFAGNRIARVTTFEDAGDALREIGLDPATAYAVRREDPELVVWLFHTRLERGEDVDDLQAPDATREGSILQVSPDLPSRTRITERFAELDALYSEWCVRLTDTFMAADGRVVATVSAHGTFDGVEHAHVGATVFDVRGGLIRHMTAYSDVHDAFDAVSTAQSPAGEYRDLFDAAGVGLVHHAADGRIIDVNENAMTILGLTSEQLCGRTPLDSLWRVVREDDSLFPGEEHPASVTLRTGAEQTGVIMGVHKPDGTLTWISVTSRLVAPAAAGGPREVLVSFTDITALVTASDRAQDELESELLHDALTGLPNRVLFMNRLEHALHQMRRGEGTVAVLFIDLDHFKAVNDSQGHEAGDRALIAVGRLATDALRPGDTVARLSGDEFAALCTDCTLPEAQAIAGRISDAVSGIHAGSPTMPLGASIGIARSDDPAIPPADLLAHADSAMYAAKQSGRGRFVTYTADLG